jgi:hypothetical protein
MAWKYNGMTIVGKSDNERNESRQTVNHKVWGKDYTGM